MIGRFNEWAYRRVYPMPMAVALMTPMPRRWVGLFTGIWWLAHFFGSAMVAMGIETVWHEEGWTPQTVWGLAGRLLLLALSIGATYSGNTFLLLAAGSVGGEPEKLERVWRWRWAIDAGVLLTVLGIMLISSN